MLISCRREGETLHIGEEIEIRVVSIRKNKVVLGVIAPRSVKIAAGKLTEEALANTVAATNAVSIARLLPNIPVHSLESPVSLFKAVTPEETGPLLVDKRTEEPE
jgi:carbon storage regulator CsrA